jgi:hypothetical protein
MVSNQSRQPRTLGEDSFDLSSSSFVGIPKERTMLWGEGTFTLKVPPTAKLIDSDHAGIYLAWNNAKVQVFAKDPEDDSVDLKDLIGKQIIARGELWRKTWENGREGLYFDLIGPVERQDGMTSSHEFKVHGPELKKDREPVFTVSIPDCDGIVAIYTYVPFVRP